MSFNPQTFIEISKELDKGNSEAHLRSLISRAYYAAFGHIKNKLQYSDTSISVHRNLIHELKNSPNKPFRKIGGYLETLFYKRLDADYEYDKVMSKNSYSFIIHDAESIINKFDEALSEKK
jgi:uncharacterized protein (UPF0332 family)